MRLHVFWFVLYSSAIVVEVLCDSIAVRCIAIAGLAIVSFRSLWQVRQSWYDYGFDEGQNATLAAFSAYAQVAVSNQHPPTVILSDESIQDAPVVHQLLP